MCKHKYTSWDFPGDPVVKNPPSNAGKCGLNYDLACHRATRPMLHDQRKICSLQPRPNAAIHKETLKYIPLLASFLAKKAWYYNPLISPLTAHPVEHLMSIRRDLPHSFQQLYSFHYTNIHEKTVPLLARCAEIQGTWKIALQQICEDLLGNGFPSKQVSGILG